MPNPFLDDLDSMSGDLVENIADSIGDEDLEFGDDDTYFGDEDDFGADPRRARAMLALPQLARLKGLRTLHRPMSRQQQLAVAGYRAARAARAASWGRAIEQARGNDLMFGLDSGSAGIAAATTANLSTSPQKRNIPKRLIVSDTVASTFVLSGAFVGVEPILATTSNISMAAFVQNSNIPAFRAVVNEVGMDFSLTVTNISGANQRFVATVVGTYVPYGFRY